MGRRVTRTINSGVVLLDNIEMVEDDQGNVISLRCMHCNKFVSKKIEHFYCPHCQGTFLDGVTFEDMMATENLVKYLEDIEELMNND